MLARLKGLVDDVAEESAVINVGGVGYLVFCSSRTLSSLPAVGQAVRLEIETHVREDHIHLYGFRDAAERDWFRLLTTVQGVGARVALAILSVLAPDALVQAVAAQDKAAVAQANGIGPKLAQRIVSELKDKVGGIAFGPVVAGASAPAVGALAGGASDDAVSALVNLGYGRSEAFSAVAKVGQAGAGDDVSALIRDALRELGK